MTDGSAENAVRNGGSGAYIRRSDGTTSSLSIPAGDLSSNYRAEVHTLKAATEHLIEEDCKQQNIVLLSDSLSALQSLTNGPTDFRTQQLHNSLCNLSDNNRVVLQWVPAHIGIAGHETADRLAKAAAKLPQLHLSTTVEFKPYYKTLLSENLGSNCREWPAEKTNAEVQMLVEANSKPHDIVIYTDGSVTRDRSGWGFTVKQDVRTVYEDSGAHRVTTSSLTMEVEAVTHAMQWLASQRDARITHAIILTDSMNLLQKVESGMGCPDWHTAMRSLRLQRLLWIYCPGHAGVSGNEQADRLASTADITSGLQLGRAEVLRGLRNFLSTDKPEHHSIDRLKERGVEKGSGRHSTLQGRERSVFNQTNIGTVSRATLGRLLRDGAERVWAFPSATMPS